MMELVAALPDQLRWAASVDPPPMDPATTALVAGMGGSGISGDVASVIAAAEGRRVTVHKSYGLPGWAESETLIAVSHSGNTEETIAAFEAARRAGMATGSVSTGGRLAAAAAEAGAPHLTIPDSPQPRAAFGHLAGAVLRLLERAGVLGPQSAALLEAAEVVEELLAGPGKDVADRVADAALGRLVVVYGADGLGAVAAGRWKTQINENAKTPAYWATLPEANHNEIVGWTARPGLAASAIAAVFLEDPDDHPRVRLRSRLTRELMDGVVPVAGVVQSHGSGTLARLMSLAVIGDLVSVRLAEAAGVDPVPVDVIEELKRRLAE
jgi:glucose/mannose-6-phosphate isomerase